MNLMSLMIFVEKQESRKSCDDFCWEAGIKKELIVPYNPQQNGVEERKNRKICEAAKGMITDIDLPLSLWVEATETAMYIQNRSPHAILGEKTPEEVFTKKKPAVWHSCVCSCAKRKEGQARALW